MRRDLKCNRGKEIAQGSHSSIAFITNRIKENPNKIASELFTEEEKMWVEGNFAKICLQVSSEQELMEIYEKAKESGLTVSLITDSGLTYFKNVPTRTCLSIGPHYSDKIDPITSKLALY